MNEIEMLRPSEVASMFGVAPKTVSRWAKAGKLRAIRTIGGHRRYPVDQIRALLNPPAEPAEGAVCYRCRGDSGELIDRGVNAGDKRWFHAFGRCPS